MPASKGKPDLLRAFPVSGNRWCVQNMTRGTEHEVDVEAWTCTCARFEHQRKCEKHIPFAVHRAKLYAGDRAEYERWVEQQMR
jgi:hypothetical protein